MDANHVTGPHAEDAILAVSLELSAAQWKVALHDGFGEKPAVHTVSAQQAEMRLQAVLELIAQQKQKWSLQISVMVIRRFGERDQSGRWCARLDKYSCSDHVAGLASCFMFVFRIDSPLSGSL